MREAYTALIRRDADSREKNMSDLHSLHLLSIDEEDVV